MRSNLGQRWLWVALSVLAGPASAIEFKVPFGENGIDAVLNSTITAGVQMRMQEPSADLIGKANLDPDVCGRLPDGRPLYQSCQGLFRTQSYPAARLSEVPGAFSNNFDDGNLNYRRHDLTQAPLKLTQDLTFSHGDFGFFARGIYFYDFVNNDFTEYHPNRITRENYLDVGTVATAANNNGLPRNDSQPCGDRNPVPGSPCGIVYGAGGVVKGKRRENAALSQIGQGLQLLDAVIYGKAPLPLEKELTWKFGRQTINWGESTLLVINSVNQAQPVNANNFLRTGFAVEEVFTPQTSLFGSFEPFEGATIEAYYQLEWQPVEIPTPGSYFSFADLGTNNTGDFVTVSFGGAAEDQDGAGRLLDNALSGLTDTSLNVQRLKDREPDRFGLTNQFGVSLKYYAEWLNSGTELGVYFMNYHSKLPYISTYAAIDSCARYSRSSTQFLNDCPNIPLIYGITNPNQPDQIRYNADGSLKAVNDYSAVPFDSAKLQFEYPKNIQMLGLSFNTTVGEYSIQGEVAYRPKMPLQVDVEDLLFATYGPTLTLCHQQDISAIRADRPGACAGTGDGSGVLIGALPAALQPLASALAAATGQSPDVVGGVGTDPTGATMVYPSSDWVISDNGTPDNPYDDIKGNYNDTFDLLVGHATGSARSFPSFIIPYRNGAGAIGNNPGSDPTRPYNHSNPGYIRGYEELGVFQFNFGGTQVLGATDNWIGADQILGVLEVGATWVPDLPPLDVLQFEAPGTLTHASAGADGSGAFYTDANRRQACSTNPTCSFGPDGLRFNPHQADLSLYPDKFSWGYRVISIIRYESVFPGISFQPFIIWQQDLQGTAPQPLDTNFVEGRKTASINFEIRYKSSLSFNPGYTWFSGGKGASNTYRDRDFAQFYVRYQF